ncbi:MAG: nitrate reductase molybdenum cofactor assembly chaperone [Acidithiobacillus sp.]|uniref:nitrate reductase molybdenum cofactor assembly chaperone n=1 Tax=Acidithiobacillus sp. TaxID=1872118 RepID=UPI003CFE49A1
MDTEVRNRLYQVVSALLGYPDAELRAALPEIRDYLVTAPDLEREERSALLGMVHWMESQLPLDLESAYVQTFDLNPDHDLHLTYHLFEEGDRERGPAMIHLAEHYESYGLAIVGNELPDYLPLILEYASTLDDDEARIFLGNAVHAVETLGDHLEKAESPYASLVRFVERRGRLAELSTMKECMP